ncbi:MAG: hypothetical protein B5M51_08085 [Anaerolinea sp. 4484_236]|nr:MAG: hypothetical protein B5M51_08085 [Anaerolinea sp. 4484_236]
MKKLRLMTIITLSLGVLILMLTIGDFLALHDINKDYVSMQALHSLDISLSEMPPAWTETKGEWDMVSLSLFARGGFLMLNTFTLWLCFKGLREEKTS